MPDGDRFCWGVRGRGSRTLLNVVRSRTAADLVADQASTVVGEQCKSLAIQRVIVGALPLLIASLPRFDTDASQALPSADEVRRRLRLLRGEAGGEPFAMVVQRHRRGLEEMDWQVARLRGALGAPDPWGMLIHAFPDLLMARDALTTQGSDFTVASDALIELYRHHCEEWVEFRGQQLLQRQAA